MPCNALGVAGEPHWPGDFTKVESPVFLLEKMENNLHTTELSNEEVEQFLSLMFKGLPSQRSGIGGSSKRRIVYGVMSSDRIDLEKDMIVQAGIDTETIAAKYGRLKWAHKEIKGPAANIGQLLGVRKAVSGKDMLLLDPDGDYDLKKSYSLLVAEIFGEDKGLKLADEAWKTAKAYDEIGKPLGFSVEGIPIEKKGKKINKSALVNAVLTTTPINMDSKVHVLKSVMLEKAMKITPVSDEIGDRTGGAALQTDNFTNSTRRKKMSEKKKKRGLAFNDSDELDAILDDNKFDDETKKKLQKALFKEVDIEEEEETDDDVLKSKGIESLKAELGELNKGLDDITKLLESGGEVAEPEPDYTASIGKGFDDLPGFNPGEGEIDERIMQSLKVMAKGIESGLGHAFKVDGKLKEVIQKSLELNSNIMKAIEDRDATIKEMKKGMGEKIAKLEKGLEKVSAEPDGFPTLDELLGKPGDELYKGLSASDLISRANTALGKGDITADECESFIVAVENKKRPEAQVIIKGIASKFIG